MNNHPETAPLTPAVTDGDLPGALVISLDFEQHWGVRDKHAAAGATRARLIGAREAVPAMLGAFRRYGVAATWATVGMLFAEDADRLRLSHPAVRPAYRDPNLAPYAEPVGDDEAADPMHFALSLVRQVAATPRQEIATHTYSHFYCTEAGATSEAFAGDLDAAVALMRAAGFAAPRSIVFPRNQHEPAFGEVLRSRGIDVYRGNSRTWMYRYGDGPRLKRWHRPVASSTATPAIRISWPGGRSLRATVSRTCVRACIADDIAVVDCDDAVIERMRDLAAAYFPEGHQARDATFLRWLYVDNPFGRARAVIASAGAVTTAMMALVPVRFCASAGPHEGFFVVNVLSHPAHRGRNLFVKLIRATKAHFASTDAWLLGHPNENARPGWTRQKMQFRSPYALRLVLPAPSRRGRLVDAIAPADLERLDFGRLAATRLAAPAPVVAVDARYLAWRFLRHPTRSYRLRLRCDGDAVSSYAVTRPLRAGVRLVVDWQNDGETPIPIPDSWRGPVLAVAPVDASEAARPITRRSVRVPIVAKRYAFFATPLGAASGALDDWGAFTLAPTDFA